MGMSCDGCLNCVGVQGGDCAEQAAACSMSVECNALFDCLDNCSLSDTMCVMQCDTDHSAGLAAYKAINDCENMACASLCDTPPSCPNKLSWPSGGSCYASFNCNPVTNEGCTAPQICSYDGMGYSCFTLQETNKVCVSCESNPCAAGLICANVDLNNTLTCAQLCCNDADCGTLGVCLNDGGIPGGGFCVKK
jgi:hypothetical protein